MSNWNATHYLRYSDERTRPSHDLVARIQINTPRVIVDLGCGPGNSTQVLRDRWPHAHITGIDNSHEMIEAAKRAYPDQNWLLDDAATWTPAESVDLLFSNATLQWLPDHKTLMGRLFSLVQPEGVFAFQIPSHRYATVRTLIHDISHLPAWTDRMDPPRRALTMESPAFYYDILADRAATIDLWETEYYHVMDSPEAVIDWISSTGLRPFLAVLNTENERQEFLSELHRRVQQAYPIQSDGKVLFPFCRTFVVANRK